MVSDAQTAYALALCFDLLPRPEQRQRVAARLAELVAKDGYHIGTGFVGTPLVCEALVNGGYVDETYHLLLQDECPSWLYPVSMGATATALLPTAMSAGRVQGPGLHSRAKSASRGSCRR
jgi:alpha-L-rhamnosidase